MKRAIVVAVLAVLALIFAFVVVDCEQTSGPTRTPPETKRAAPGSGVGGPEAGAESPPAEMEPVDE